MNLEPFQLAEFDERLAIARGKPNPEWWANYALALSAHGLFADAAAAARESRGSEWDAEAFVGALQSEQAPMAHPALAASQQAIDACRARRVAQVWRTHKRLSNQHAQQLWGADLAGWFERCGDDWVAVPREAPRENAIDLLVDGAGAIAGGTSSGHLNI